jgi:hypothetical protein
MRFTSSQQAKYIRHHFLLFLINKQVHQISEVNQSVKFSESYLNSHRNLTIKCGYINRATRRNTIAQKPQ